MIPMLDIPRPGRANHVVCACVCGGGGGDGHLLALTFNLPNFS